MTPFVLTAIVVILVVGGEVLWKIGATDRIHSLKTFFEVVFSPLIIVGTFLYLLATGVWLLILSRYQLHLVYPLLASSVILTLLASRFLLQEQVALFSWIGAAVISIGIILIGFSFR